MLMRARTTDERRAKDRRTSPASIFDALAALLGPRLRRQSAFQLRVGLEAIPAGSGAVMIVTIPASLTTPVEVRTYPAGVAIGLLDSAQVSVGQGMHN